MLGRSEGVKSYFLPMLSIGLFVVCFYPAMEMLALKWKGSEDYTHAFFVVPIIGYMIWHKIAGLDKSKSSFFGLLLLIISLIGYLLALKIQIPTLIFLTVFCAFLSSFIFLYGFQVVKELFLPFLLLILVIPIPNQILGVVTASLQLWVSDTATTLVRLLSIPIFQEGNILHVAGKTFQVVDACSGIRSLISMTTLSLVIGYFTLSRKRSVFLLFCLSIPIAVVINVVRVVSMLLAYHYLKMDLTVGTPHTIAGLGLFGLGLILLFTFQRVLELWETKKTNSYLS